MSEEYDEIVTLTLDEYERIPLVKLAKLQNMWRIMQERIAALEKDRDYLPANWMEDSSLETWFPLTSEEMERLKAENKRLSAPVSDEEMRLSLKVSDGYGHGWFFDREGTDALIAARAKNHCPACASGQSLDAGEGTHLLGTVEHEEPKP